jgi:hypothetical protein
MTVGNAGAQPLTFGRAPFLARPFLRAMFVVAQVSSMKTRRSGSRPSWFSNHASRCFKISGRSRSLACAVFFPRNVVTVEEAPQRSDAEAMPALGKLCGKFLERDVAALLDERRDQTEMRVDARRPTVPPRGLAAGLPISFSRAHQRTALAAETPKRSAACRRDMPAATAETTRSRRSSERVFFDMHASLLRQQAV